jgi:hypothetical protein
MDITWMIDPALDMLHAGYTQTELVQLCFGDLIADGGPMARPKI